MATFLEVAKIMTDLTAAFPDFDPPDRNATLKQYHESLKHYPMDLLEKAKERCRSTCYKFPMIADLRKAADEIHAAEANKTYQADKQQEKKSISPEMEKYLDDFRQKMIASGKWKAKPRRRQYDPYAGFVDR